MSCPLCTQRKARRSCPALDRQICTVCCGTKRLVEIRCKPDCPYLSSSRTHPPAVVQRQQQQDRAALVPIVQGLSDRQANLFVLFAGLINRYGGDALQRITDQDIEQAAGALAATLETAERGILYDHRPSSLPAQGLLTEIQAALQELTKDGGHGVERDAVVVLRRLEQGARQARQTLPGGESAFQQLLGRTIKPRSEPTGVAAAAEGSRGSIIIAP
jgi:hypothetical protein